jgi:hypothetical protein
MTRTETTACRRVSSVGAGSLVRLVALLLLVIHQLSHLDIVIIVLNPQSTAEYALRRCKVRSPDSH